MSGTGKSTALAELERRGFRVVDTDDPPWSEWSESDGGYVWREDLVTELLAERRRPDALCLRHRLEPGTLLPTLRRSGAAERAGRSAPRANQSRTTNDYGKAPEERALILEQIAEVEPLLRAGCTHEIDAAQPLDDVVEQLAAIGSG